MSIDYNSFGLAPVKNEGCICIPNYPVINNFMSGNYDIDLVSLKLEMETMFKEMRTPIKERSISRFLKGIFGDSGW